LTASREPLCIHYPATKGKGPHCTFVAVSVIVDWADCLMVATVVGETEVEVVGGIPIVTEVERTNFAVRPFTSW